MVKNYFKIALRSLTKHKGYTLINMLGLTLGITTCLLICLYIQHELSYDRFHEKADNIYRINNTYHTPQGDLSYPTVSPALPLSAKDKLPEVANYVRFSGLGQNNEAIIRIADRFYKEQDVFAVDPTVFEVFSFRLKQGNPATALQEPFSVVLTEEAAQRLFGDSATLGTALQLTGNLAHEYKVTGILENVPDNSHMTFNMLVSMETVAALYPEADLDNNWAGDGFYAYLLLSSDQHPKHIEQALQKLNEQNLDATQAAQRGPSLTALTDIHLHSNLLNEMEPNGSMAQVYTFIAIAIFLLAIAVINYMNLATARSAQRAREVGMRKALGAMRSQIIGQFLSESVLLVLLASLISLLLAQVLLPAFNQLSGKQLTFHLTDNPLIMVGLLLVIVLTGIASGSYPALFLSSFKPAEVLKGKLAVGMNSSPLLRKGLVIFQFVVSVILIIGAWMVYSQLDYLKNKDLGFQKEHMIVIQNTDNAITQQLAAFKRELSQHPQVHSVGASLSVPGGLRPIMTVKAEAMGDDSVMMAGINTDFEYLQTMGIQLTQGRDFDPKYTTDSTEAIIINRQAIKELGLQGNPIGQVLRVNVNNEFQERQIIGVVEDINFEPLYRKTEGAFFASLLPLYSYIFVKIAPQERNQTLAFLEQTWNQFAPGQPFDYSFLDEDLNQLYVAEQKLGTVVTYFSILAVIIACLGLFGLASFATEQRRKEIGIRKVLGSSNTGIVLLFFKEYARIIVIANLIAWPLAYYLVRQYMDNFVFHIAINWVVFLMAGVLVCLIALLTVGAKAVRAAMRNPVDSLNYD